MKTKKNFYPSTSHTILKDPFDIQSVRGTRLIISTTFQVASQLPGSGIVNQSWVTLTDRVLRADENDWYITDVGVILGHFGVVGVDGIEAHLVLQAENEDDGVNPVCELHHQTNGRTRVHTHTRSTATLDVRTFTNKLAERTFPK